MRHLHHLAVNIGPRGSTTEGEKAAANYAASELSAAGLAPQVEPFESPVSGWRPYAIAAGAGLAAVALAIFGGTAGAWGAVVLMGATTASVLLELYFQPNLLRPFIPKASSQNVWARIPAKRPSAPKVLLAGHIDTHRTPWVFTSPGRLTFFRLLSTAGTASYILSVLIFLLMTTMDFGPWRWLLLLFVPIHLLVMGISLQPDRTPFTAGANDNASGAAIVLSLAQRLAREPFENLEVWAICTGCEEVGSVGMQAFIDQHQTELGDAWGISIDNVGGEGVGVCYTTVEGILIPLRPDKTLLALADRVAEERPELNAYSQPFTFLHTDGTCMMTNQIPALSFVGLTPNGRLPHWHQISDTFEQVNPQTVENHETFLLALLHRLDQQVGASS